MDSMHFDPQRYNPDKFQVSPSSWLYWKEITEGPILSQEMLVDCAIKWAIKMQQEMAHQNIICLTRDIAFNTFDELASIDGKIPLAIGIPLLIMLWRHGSELGTAYNYNNKSIEKLKNYASNANAGRRQKDIEYQDPYLSRKRVQDYYDRLHNEKAIHDFKKEKELLERYDYIKIEFNSPNAEHFLLELDTRERTTALLFMKVAQAALEEKAQICKKYPEVLDGTIIEKAQGTLYCKLTSKADAFIIPNWKYGPHLKAYYDRAARSPEPGFLRKALTGELIKR